MMYFTLILIPSVLFQKTCARRLAAGSRGKDRGGLSGGGCNPRWMPVDENISKGNARCSYIVWYDLCNVLHVWFTVRTPLMLDDAGVDVAPCGIIVGRFPGLFHFR